MEPMQVIEQELGSGMKISGDSIAIQHGSGILGLEYDQLSIRNVEKIHPLQYHRHFLSQGVHSDGRKITDFRQLEIKTDTISCCAASSTVTLGKTTVVCGVKANIMSLNSRNQDEGVIVVKVTTPALCYGGIDHKLSFDISTYATQYITDVLESSAIINRKKLCIKPGKSAWIIYADICCLNHQGNVIDASIVALVSALKNLKLSNVIYDDSVNQITVPNAEKYPVNILNDTIVPATFGVFDDKIIVADPSFEEEKMCAMVSTVLDSNENICGIFKYSCGSIDHKIHREIIDLAIARAAALIPILEKIPQHQEKKPRYNAPDKKKTNMLFPS